MPLSVLQPPAIARITYSFLIAAGVAFSLTQDAESVRVIVGDWAPTVTGTMLIVGGGACILGLFVRRYALEAAGVPFLVGVWLVYGIAIAVRHYLSDDGTPPPPLGFAFLLTAGGFALIGRGVEMVKAYRIDRDLRLRQSRRKKAATA